MSKLPRTRSTGVGAEKMKQAEVIEIPRDAIVIVSSSSQSDQSTLLNRLAVSSKPFMFYSELKSAEDADPVLKTYREQLEKAAEEQEQQSSEEKAAGEAIDPVVLKHISEVKQPVFAKLLDLISKNKTLLAVEGPTQDKPVLLHEIIDAIKAVFVNRPLVLLRVVPPATESSDQEASLNDKSSQHTKKSGKKASTVGYTGYYPKTSEHLVKDPELIEFQVA